MDISYEKILYRIIKGRLRIKLGDLVLYIREPTDDVLEESYEIYDEAYERAYLNGVFVDQELRDLLYDLHLWNPADDKRIKELEKKIEDLKVEAYKSFFDPSKLRAIKGRIKIFENEHLDILSRNKSLDHITCRGAATFSRNVWMIQECTYLSNGDKYKWDKYDVSKVMRIFNEYPILPEEYRMIARNDPWRSMWVVGKNMGNLLNKPSCDFTTPQRQLCAYSNMYDNVYESMEKPNDKVIEDDICLDGWFIDQKREMEKKKKQQEVDALTSNPKISNSQEVFVMASDQEAANQIYDLNDPLARSTIRQRKETIAQAGGDNLDFRQLHDIKQDIAIQSHQEGINKIRGR